MTGPNLDLQSTHLFSYYYSINIYFEFTYILVIL